MRNTPRFPIPALALLLLSVSASAQPVDRSELEALRAQVRQLEEQLRLISQQLSRNGAAENTRVAPAPAAPVAPGPAVVTANDRGYMISSADANNAIRLRGLLQLDSRLFLDDGGISNNTFILRRARVISDGKLARSFAWQFVTEFGGTTMSILDANFSVALTDELQLKIGKFKTPVGLEVLQPDAATTFAERSMLAGFLPNRDLGIQLGGPLYGGKVTFTAGIFNGVADGANSTNVDFDEAKDAVVRVLAAPFSGDARLRGLSFGMGASTGRRKTTAGRTAGYRSDGQQLFFTYLPSAIADGYAWRVSPQVDYRVGPFGLMGEYLVSAINLRPSAVDQSKELRHRGWQIAAGYVLTGEDSSYSGIFPRTDFNPAAGTWGAFQILARYANVKMDDDAFPTFALPTTSANEARAGALGLTWYLSKAVLFKFDYYHTGFSVAPLPTTLLTPVLRQDEKAFVSRFQLSF